MECIQCGKEEGEYDGLCGKCYLEHYATMEVPEYLQVILCPHCGALKRGEHWLNADSPEVSVTRVVNEAVRFSPSDSSIDIELDIVPETEYVYRVGVHASLYIKGMVARKDAGTTVRVEGHVCDVCSRRHGNYYESIVQLRGYHSKLDKEEKDHWLRYVNDTMESMGATNRQVFLAKTVEMHGGLDFYLSTTDAGKILAREFVKRAGATIKESASIAGRKDGRDLYRVTFSVRLPPVRIGDYFRLDDEIYRVEKVNKNKIDTLKLINGEPVRMKRDVDDKMAVLGGEELVRDAVIVFEGKEEVQLLDPENYKTVQIRKPLHFVGGGDSVGIIRHEGQLYIA